MLECPFDTLSCSWPRPIVQENKLWMSEPEWDAPLMSLLPCPYVELLHDEWYWTFYWNDFFQSDLMPTQMDGRMLMRDFHVIFRLKLKHDGLLVVSDDDGCFIRKGGEILHCNRKTQQMSGVEIEVKAGEIVEIAQWHHTGIWVWGAYLKSSNHEGLGLSMHPVDILTPYLERVQRRLQHPNGPPLKVYTNAYGPIRTIVAIYSMILNGYVPSAVYIFGDHQWQKQKRDFLKKLLPFTQIIPVTQVLAHLRSLGGDDLVAFATKRWFMMKAFVALLYPPHEFCLMDDDVFILDCLDDALEAFKTNDLVYTPNEDWGEDYLRTWKNESEELSSPLVTGKLNAGLYWLRNTKDAQSLVARVLQVQTSSQDIPPAVWEQGFIAVTYANDSCQELPFHRYYLPILDGFPGGLLGYDYARNPCGFACIHFAGSTKPSDGRVLHLVPGILRAEE